MASPDATYVAGCDEATVRRLFMTCPNRRVFDNADEADPQTEEKLKKLARMLDKLDKMLKGNARQSWGLLLWGEGDGRGGTAARLTNPDKLWGQFDYAAFMELMGEVLEAIPESSDYHEVLEGLRDELDGKEVDQLATKLFEVIEEANEFREARESGRKPDSTPLPEIVKKPKLPARSAVPPQKAVPWTPSGGEWMKQEWISGDLKDSKGQLSIYTDVHGKRRKVHVTMDARGYIHYKVIAMLN